MERLATAEWADAAEFAERRVYQEGTFWLGRSPLDGRPLGHLDDRHIMLTSGTRAGKGTTTIINNLCLWPGSVVVVDPKGENATVTAGRRGDGSDYSEGMGQRVHVLDPFEASSVEAKYRSRFNPLDALDPDSPSIIDDADLIADAIVVISDRASEPEWQETAKVMLKGLILHVVTHPMFEGRRNLLTVRELIRQGDRDGVEMLREVGAEKIPSARQLLWEAVAKNTALGGVISGVGDHMAELLLNAPKQFEGYHAPLDLNTKFLDSPMMQSVLTRSNFDLAALKTDPKGVSLYLCLPHRYMGTHARWLRMMVALTTAKMEEVAHQPISGHRVLMVLDEFAKLETMRSIEHAVSYIAGFGVTMLFVLQSLEQLKKYYKDGWETFLGCTGTKLFFSIDDQFTREHVAKLLGDTELIRTVRSANTSTTETRSSTRGRTRSHTEGSTDSETRSENTSHTDGIGVSHTSGTSRSVSKSRGVSQTSGTNRSRAFGLSQTAGWNCGRSESTNRGGSSSTSENKGGSQESGLFSLGRRTTSSGFGVTKGRQWGRSSSSSQGSSGTEGQTQNQSHGDSSSESASRNKSVSRSVSRSHTTSRNQSSTVSSGTSVSHSMSRSLTEAESESETLGSSTGTTKGESETVHKRPLMTPEELGHIFDRPTEGEPGLALVLLGGGRPAAVVRSPYFADDHFAWLYDPHPDHAPPMKRIGVEDFLLGFDLHPLMMSGTIRALINSEKPVTKALPIAGLEMPLPPGHETDTFRELVGSFGSSLSTMSIPSGRVLVPILSPVSGTMVECKPVGPQPGTRPQKIAAIRIDRRRVLLDVQRTVDAGQHLRELSDFLYRYEGELRARKAALLHGVAERARIVALRKEIADLYDRRRLAKLRKGAFQHNVWIVLISIVTLPFTMIPMTLVAFLPLLLVMDTDSVLLIIAALAGMAGIFLGGLALTVLIAFLLRNALRVQTLRLRGFWWDLGKDGRRLRKLQGDLLTIEQRPAHPTPGS